MVEGLTQSVHPSWDPWLHSVLAGAQAQLMDAEATKSATVSKIRSQVQGVESKDVTEHIKQWLTQVAECDDKLTEAQELAKRTEQGIALLTEVERLQGIQQQATEDLRKAELKHSEALQQSHEAAEQLAGILSYVQVSASKSPELLSRGKSVTRTAQPVSPGETQPSIHDRGADDA